LRPADDFRGSLRSYHCSFLDSDPHYRRQATELLTRTFAPHVDRLLNGYRILTANFYVKPPGGRELVPHQNWPGIADLNDTALTLWCPMVDTDASNGAMQFVPGSHKLVPHVQGPGLLPFTHRIEPEVARHLELFPMSAGDAVLFDESLIHASVANTSDRARIAVQIVCVPADVPAVYFFHREDGTFELIEAEPEFWLKHGPNDLAVRSPDWTSLGIVRGANRFVDAEEFEQLLADGPQIRKRGHRLEPVAGKGRVGNGLRSLFNRR
jgi:hypothetical protein